MLSIDLLYLNSGKTDASASGESVSASGGVVSTTVSCVSVLLSVAVSSAGGTTGSQALKQARVEMPNVATRMRVISFFIIFFSFQNKFIVLSHRR